MQSIHFYFLCIQNDLLFLELKHPVKFEKSKWKITCQKGFFNYSSFDINSKRLVFKPNRVPKAIIRISKSNNETFEKYNVSLLGKIAKVAYEKDPRKNVKS
jgi:hypothetical protein